MNKQIVALITTDEVAKRIKKVLTENPSEAKRVSVFKLEKGGNVFYWDYECFLDVIDKRLGITSILSDYKDSTSEGYKLFINWDDQYSDTVVNDVGEEVFEDYDMEYLFNFIDGMKYNMIKETIANVINQLNLVGNTSEIDTNKLIVELDKINSIVTSLKDNKNDVINENYGV